MTKLYELANDYMEIVNLEGQAPEEQLELIKSVIQEEVNNKSGNIIKLIKNIESDVKAIDEEIKRLNSIKKIKNNTINNIKEYTKQNLVNMDIKKIQTPFGNISIRNNPPSLNIPDETLVPDNFKEKVVEYVISSENKKAIKEILKEGNTVPGCELTYGKSIIIK